MFLPTTGTLISRRRLRNIPKAHRLAHEYSFFLHDQCVQILKDYEAESADRRTLKFRNETEGKRFAQLAAETDVIGALRKLGYAEEALRTIINQITIALTSDMMHHIYEALKCLERRKSIVALNLLRKPLTDNLILLAWIFGDEECFYQEFENNSPTSLSPSRIGNRRRAIIEDAFVKLDLPGVITADLLFGILFDSDNTNGLYGVFQHAVHLVTVQRPSLKTTPENLNFVFKDPEDDEIYELIYANLPVVMIVASSLIMGLYDRIQPSDQGAKNAFYVRSRLGFMLLYEPEWRADVIDIITEALGRHVKCAKCDFNLRVTVHNAARLLMTESFRCTHCRRINPFPFAWLF